MLHIIIFISTCIDVFIFIRILLCLTLIFIRKNITVSHAHIYSYITVSHAHIYSYIAVSHAHIYSYITVSHADVSVHGVCKIFEIINKMYKSVDFMM